MDENVNANPKDSGATPQEVNSVNKEESHSNDEVALSEDKVRYTTYKRTVDEVHKLKAMLDKANGELESLNLDKLEQEGQWKTGYEQQKVRGDSLEQKLKDVTQDFATNALKGKIRQAAVQLGCSGDSQLNCVMDSLSKDDLGAIEVNGLEPNAEDVKRLVDQKKKDLWFLFDKPAPSIDDRTPNQGLEKVAPKSPSEMSIDQKIELLRNELTKQE